MTADRSYVTILQAISMLGIEGDQRLTTINFMLEHGSFPGAYKTNTGAWRIPAKDVRMVKSLWDELLRQKRLEAGE